MICLEYLLKTLRAGERGTGGKKGPVKSERSREKGKDEAARRPSPFEPE